MAGYSKQQQLNIKAGTKEASELLKRAFRSRHKRNPSNKYNASPAVFQGRTYHSITECRYAQQLELRKQAKEIVSWKPQVSLRLIVNGEWICDYLIDFKVIHNDDRTELIEVKGAETQDWKKKFSLTKALLPKGDIPGVPKDARLTLVKSAGKKFIHQPQVLNYE